MEHDVRLPALDSAAEFRRYLVRFMHMADGFNQLHGIMRTTYDEYDSRLRPLDWDPDGPWYGKLDLPALHEAVLRPGDSVSDLEKSSIFSYSLLSYS